MLGCDEDLNFSKGTRRAVGGGTLSLSNEIGGKDGSDIGNP
jgi:hypothetical protein